MEWLFDPTAWAGVFTLILLELILGIDNLVFIAILAQKLPPHQRDRARQIGLALALLMRILLLLSISWLASLTDPVMTLFGKVFSARDLILLFGGLFLLFKATNEIHGRLEGRGHRPGKSAYKARYWMVILQIVILDAVFSLDAVITAVGMVEHVSMMIVGVTVAIAIMMVTSKPLTIFVNKHPTVVMLCLGFLLMVGFSLVAEGFGAEIPKGYLYAAIGFSVMIEAINQFAQAKLKKRVVQAGVMRQNAADAILKLLGAKQVTEGEETQEMGLLLQEAARGNVLTPVEKELLRGVLNLSQRPVRTIMTPRQDVEFIDIRDVRTVDLDRIRSLAKSHIVVVDGELDNVLGLLRRDDFLRACLDGSARAGLSPKMLHEPVFVRETASVMSVLERFRKKHVKLAVVVDNAGSVEGVISHIDLLEAITGEFPDREDPLPVDVSSAQDDGSILLDGMMSIYDLCNRLNIDYAPDGRFATLAGLVLHELGRFPALGDKMEWQGWTLEVAAMDGRRIDRVRMTPASTPQA